MNNNKNSNVLRLTQRVEVINEYNSSTPKPSFEILAKQYNVSSTQIRSILLNQEFILQAYAEVFANGDREPQKQTMKIQEKSDLSLSRNRNVLGLADRVKVIQEYTTQKPQPAFNALALKYNVSCGQITSILLNQESILNMYEETRQNNIVTDSSVMREKQRQDKIDFIGKVVLEYIERTMYYNVTIDDDMVKHKTAEIKECIAVKNFRPTDLWLADFKKEYGIDSFDLKSLRNKITIKEEKRRQVDAIDMVQYVRHQEHVERARRSRKTYSSVSIENTTQTRATTEPRFVEDIENPLAAKRLRTNSPHQQKGDLCSDVCEIQTPPPQKGNTDNPQIVYEIPEDININAKRIRLHNHVNSAQSDEIEAIKEKQNSTQQQLRQNNDPKTVTEKSNNVILKDSATTENNYPKDNTDNPNKVYEITDDVGINATIIRLPQRINSAQSYEKGALTEKSTQQQLRENNDKNTVTEKSDNTIQKDPKTTKNNYAKDNIDTPKIVYEIPDGIDINTKRIRLRKNVNSPQPDENGALKEKQKSTQMQLMQNSDPKTVSEKFDNAIQKDPASTKNNYPKDNTDTQMVYEIPEDIDINTKTIWRDENGALKENQKSTQQQLRQNNDPKTVSEKIDNAIQKDPVTTKDSYPNDNTGNNKNVIEIAGDVSKNPICIRLRQHISSAQSDQEGALKETSTQQQLRQNNDPKTFSEKVVYVTLKDPVTTNARYQKDNTANPKNDNETYDAVFKNDIRMKLRNHIISAKSVQKGPRKDKKTGKVLYTVLKDPEKDNTRNTKNIYEVADNVSINAKRIKLSQHISTAQSNGIEAQTEKSTQQQLRQNNDPKTVSAKVDNAILKNPATTKNQLFQSSFTDNDCLIINVDEPAVTTINTEITPMQLDEEKNSEFISENVNNKTLPTELLDKNLPSNSSLPNTEDNLLKSLLSGVTVDRATIKIEMSPRRSNEVNESGVVFEKLDDEVLLPNLHTHQTQQSGHVVDRLEKADLRVSTLNELLTKTGSDDEFLTIYQIVDEEAAIMSPNTSEGQCSESLLLEVERELERIDAEIPVIKQEPLMSDNNIEPNTSSYIEISNEISKTIKQEPPSDDDDDTAPKSNDGLFQTSESIPHQPPVSGNNFDEVTVKKEISPLTEVERTYNEVPKDPCHHDQPTTLPNNADQQSNSALKAIDSREEAMKYVQLLEDYAKLKKNRWAISLITVLGEAFKESDN